MSCKKNSILFFRSGVFLLHVIFTMSGQADNLIDLFLEHPNCKIPVVKEKNFEVEICVCEYHFYKHQPNTGETLLAYQGGYPVCLIRVCLIRQCYTIAIETVGNAQKIGHVPKIMSRFMYYFIRHGGVVYGTAYGERAYSWD